MNNAYFFNQRLILMHVLSSLVDQGLYFLLEILTEKILTEL